MNKDLYLCLGNMSTSEPIREIVKYTKTNKRYKDFFGRIMQYVKLDKKLNFELENKKYLTDKAFYIDN